MRIAIMQPYFFPYIGYFQLIRAVDLFIVYDNIKYTKKGWINRNQMLVNGKAEIFTIPLKSDSDSLDIGERKLSEDFDREKLLKKILGAYRRAPNFAKTFHLVEEIVRCADPNLFHYLHHSLHRICEHLEISTQIKVSSEVPIDHSLKSQEKVLALCRAVGATSYVNAIGGLGLYAQQEFLKNGVDLKFIRSNPFEYAQFGEPFVPWLSIIDVMMFNLNPVIKHLIESNVQFVEGWTQQPHLNIE